VEPWKYPDSSESAVIMGALFDINAQLIEIGENVIAVRRLLEDDGQEEDQPEL